MKLNRNSNIGNHFLTDKNIVLSTDIGFGIGDSLGRTAQAMLLYDEDEKLLIEGVKSYFSEPRQDSPEQGKKIFATRYPGGDPWEYARGNSRDHILTAVACMRIKGQNQWVLNFLKYRTKRPRISKAYTPLQKLWMKTLYSKSGAWLYAVLQTVELFFMFLGLVISRTLSWTWKTYESPKEFCMAHPDGTAYKHLNKWRKFWVGQWIRFPMFAVYYTAFMVNALESKSAKKYLQWILRNFFVEKSNYGLRLLLGQKDVCICGYIPSRKNRWSIRLDDACNRDMRYYDDKPEDNLEIGLLWYYLINCET